MTTSTPASVPAKAARRPLYRSLYFQVIVAIVLGVLLGALYPQAGEAMKPLGVYLAFFQPTLAPGKSRTFRVMMVNDRYEAEAGELRLTLEGAVACARRSITIMTPYFLPEAPLIVTSVVALLAGHLLFGKRVNIALTHGRGLRLDLLHHVALDVRAVDRAGDRADGRAAVQVPVRAARHRDPGNAGMDPADPSGILGVGPSRLGLPSAVLGPGLGKAGH